MRKKHLVIICGIYYPEPSPTGLCVKRFVELLKDDYNIDVICISSNNETEDIETSDGIIIHALAGGLYSKEKVARGIIKKLVHQLTRFQLVTCGLGNLNWFRKKALKTLGYIEKEKRIDLILSVCSPFVAHVAARDYKQKHRYIYWCGYTVDPYSSFKRIRPFWCSRKNLIHKEKDVLMKMDHLLISDEVFRNREDLFNGHQSYEVLPYMLPALTLPDLKENNFNNEVVNFVYAGRFYEDIRNPEPLLKTFAKICDNKFRLHLYCAGCESIVEKFIGLSNGIIKHPLVPHDEMVKIYAMSDVLVTVANSTSEFLPSKTFEYIATGKPIISFDLYSTDKVLDKYPLCLRISNIENDTPKRIKEFVTNANNKKISQIEINRIYWRNTQENIKSIFTSSFCINK